MRQPITFAYGNLVFGADGAEDLSDAAVEAMQKNKSLPAAERNKAKAELKARRLANKQKRRK